MSDRFRKIGTDVVDTDLISRMIVQPGMPAYAQIVAHFGAPVLAADGTLDRAELRKRVFQSAAERRILESYTHARIRAEAWRQVAESRSPYVIMVVPLLVESDFHERVDRVLVVDCSESTQLERLLARDAGDEKTARAIIAAQSDREARLDKADDVVQNDGSLQQLHARVDALHVRYTELSQNGDRRVS